jgi:hypothetical protein
MLNIAPLMNYFKKALGTNPLQNIFLKFLCSYKLKFSWKEMRPCFSMFFFSDLYFKKIVDLYTVVKK